MMTLQKGVQALLAVCMGAGTAAVAQNSHEQTITAALAAVTVLNDGALDCLAVLPTTCTGTPDQKLTHLQNLELAAAAQVAGAQAACRAVRLNAAEKTLAQQCDTVDDKAAGVRTVAAGLHSRMLVATALETEKKEQAKSERAEAVTDLWKPTNLAAASLIVVPLAVGVPAALAGATVGWAAGENASKDGGAVGAERAFQILLGAMGGGALALVAVLVPTLVLGGIVDSVAWGSWLVARGHFTKRCGAALMSLVGGVLIGALTALVSVPLLLLSGFAALRALHADTLSLTPVDVVHLRNTAWLAGIGGVTVLVTGTALLWTYAAVTRVLPLRGALENEADANDATAKKAAVPPPAAAPPAAAPPPATP